MIDSKLFLGGAADVGLADGQEIGSEGPGGHLQDVRQDGSRNDPVDEKDQKSEIIQSCFFL